MREYDHAGFLGLYQYETQALSAVGLIVYIIDVKHIVPVLANVERSGFCVHD